MRHKDALIYLETFKFVPKNKPIKEKKIKKGRLKEEESKERKVKFSYNSLNGEIYKSIHNINKKCLKENKEYLHLSKGRYQKCFELDKILRDNINKYLTYILKRHKRDKSSLCESKIIDNYVKFYLEYKKSNIILKEYFLRNERVNINKLEGGISFKILKDYDDKFYESISYIYIISNIDYCKENKYKIGKCNNIVQRLKDFKTFSPSEVNVFGLRRCMCESMAFKLEKIVHKYFKKFQIDDSEWFRFDDEVIIDEIIDIFYNIKLGY